MEFTKKQTIACYIDQNKALLYRDTDGSMLQIDFSANLISDQELTSAENLENLIKSFLDTNNFENGNIIFIFGPSLTIEKDFLDDSKSNNDGDIQKFIDIIPFEEVLYKIYRLNKKTKAVAINRGIYDLIKNTFEKKNFLILGVIPSSVLSETVPELSTNIDLGFIASKIYSLKEFSMINANEISSQSTIEKPGLKKQNFKLYASIIVFAIMLIIIIFVLINILQKNSPKVVPVLQPPILPTPSLPAVGQPTPSVDQSPIGSPSGSSSKF